MKEDGIDIMHSIRYAELYDVTKKTNYECARLLRLHVHRQQQKEGNSFHP